MKKLLSLFLALALLVPAAWAETEPSDIAALFREHGFEAEVEPLSEDSLYDDDDVVGWLREELDMYSLHVISGGAEYSTAAFSFLLPDDYHPAEARALFQALIPALDWDELSYKRTNRDNPSADVEYTYTWRKRDADDVTVTGSVNIFAGWIAVLFEGEAQAEAAHASLIGSALIDNEQLTVTVTGISDTDRYLYSSGGNALTLNIVLDNHSGEKVEMYVSSAAINGWEVDHVCAADVGAGHKAKDTIKLCLADADVSSYAQVETLELELYYHVGGKRVDVDPIVIDLQK